jgi:hypothetical protein
MEISLKKFFSSTEIFRTFVRPLYTYACNCFSEYHTHTISNYGTII